MGPPHTLPLGYLTFDQPSTDWPLTISAPEAAYTTIARDVFGKPTALTRSGVSPVTRSYTYNDFQQLCRSVEPETGATMYGYAAAGNLASSAAGLDGATPCGAATSRTVSRAYDSRNRLTSLSFPDGNGNQTWSYYDDGLPYQVTTSNGGSNVTNVYNYNKRRLPVSEAMVPDALYTTWAMGYGYNTLGQLVAETNPAGVTVNYAVNALGQTGQVTMTMAATGASAVVARNATYYPNGALRQFTYGNGIVHTMAQNARQLPSRSTDGNVLDMGTAFDANGNVAAVTDYIGSARQSKTMVYDGLDRLTLTTSPMFGTANYSYDALDNLKRVQVTGGSQVRDQYYCYNTNNQLDFVRSGSNCSSSPAVTALGYDVQGNLSNKNGTGYTFDYGNRLRGTAGLAYRYDAQGRRVRSDNAGAQLKYSFYSQDGRLIWQRDDPGGKRINNVYFAGSLLVELSRPIGGNTETFSYYHTDALGSPIAKTSSAGAVLETSEYEPYGKLLNRANDDRAGYTSHVMDAASGLTYMQQRYYDPTLGRFLSVDPIAANSNTGAGFNRYWYAANNPYKFTDPDGRCEKTTGSNICGGGGFAGSVVTGTRSVGPAGDVSASGGSGKSSRQAGSSSSPAPTKANAAQNGQRGFSSSSIFTGDKKITFTGVAALGSGIKAEKVTGSGNDKVSLVTPALGLSAAATVNLGTVRYDWGGPGSALDAGVSGGGIRGGLGFAGGLQLNVDSQGIELQVSGGFGAGVSGDLYGIGYKPGAD